MSLLKDIRKCFGRPSKKRDLSDQSKEGDSEDEPKKISEETSRIESLSEMSDKVCTECLKSPSCVEILFNCLRNVEKQMNGVFVLAKSTQEQQIKDKRTFRRKAFYMTLFNLFQTNSMNMKIGRKIMK